MFLNNLNIYSFIKIYYKSTKHNYWKFQVRNYKDN